MDAAITPDARISFETSPDRYRHWKLSFDGPVATLSMDVREDAALSGDYRLKLNSYDLGVDIEPADALERIRFEHPEVHAVVITSLKIGSSAPARTSSCCAAQRMPGRSVSASTPTKR